MVTATTYRNRKMMFFFWHIYYVVCSDSVTGCTIVVC